MMIQKKTALLVIFILLLQGTQAQSIPEVQVLTSGTKTSLRGLSVVNDNIIWVSGSRGTVGKSTNAGRTWKWMKVKGFDSTEFRDIEAFDGSNAIIMSVAEPAYILKTTDGGENWKLVYENRTKGMFLDAMDFRGGHGMVVGDPLNGKVFIAETMDGGETWKDWPIDKRPAADSGEAFFAASGTNIRVFDDNKFFLVSGGTRSRLFTNNTVMDLPVVQGKETTGANSISVYDKGNLKGSKQMIVVGGDFAADSSSYKNCFYTDNGGKTWSAPRIPPHGYRSSVEYLSKKDILSCGINGVDYSSDAGKTWTWISKEGFNVCRIAKEGPAIFLAGNNGKIAKITWK
jgi:photosystem II stability/assembly factor-like uncharacterized protein